MPRHGGDRREATGHEFVASGAVIGDGTSREDGFPFARQLLDEHDCARCYPVASEARPNTRYPCGET
jgi:hypothetical protein